MFHKKDSSITKIVLTYTDHNAQLSLANARDLFRSRIKENNTNHRRIFQPDPNFQGVRFNQVLGFPPRMITLKEVALFHVPIPLVKQQGEFPRGLAKTNSFTL